MKSSVKFYRLSLLILLAQTCGCATISTLSQADHQRKPLVMSGTRLNIAALCDQAMLIEKSGVPPPAFPIVDLPFSALLDLLVIGYTVPVALVNRH